MKTKRKKKLIFDSRVIVQKSVNGDFIARWFELEECCEKNRNFDSGEYITQGDNQLELALNLAVAAYELARSKKHD